jgi:thioredoxin 1
MPAEKITDANFEQVIKDNKVVLVDFWAPWCGPCRMIAPIVDELAEKYKGKAYVGKLDTDSSPKVPQRFSVMAIPTILLFKDGKLAEQITGAVPKSDIERAITKLL